VDKWPYKLKRQAAEYLQAIDEAEYREYLKTKPKKETPKRR
jgi:hypothetical protein